MAKKYSKKTLALSELHLDLKNPRLSHNRTFNNDNSVIDYLQEKEDILEIAESIVQNGVFPSEPLIVVQEDSVYTVIEGNRRLVAMKLLSDPNLAIKNKPKYTTLSSQADQSELAQLEVIVYDDRLAAAPLLIKRHTNDPAKIRQWEMIMKAYYTAGFMQAGMSLAQVAGSLDIDAISLREDIKLLQLYLLAKALPLSPSIKDKVSDEKSFSLSNLQRAMNSKVGGAMFSLKFDDSRGKLKLSYDKKEFLKPFTQLINDLADDTFNSRTHNRVEEIEDYFNSFSAGLNPDKNLPGNEDIDDVITYAETLTSLEEIYPPANPGNSSGNGNASTNSTNDSSNATGSNSATGGTSNNSNNTTDTGGNASTSSTNSSSSSSSIGRKRKAVIYNDVKPKRNKAHPRITKIVVELQKIDDGKFNNAAGVLLRTLLDLVTYEFIKAQGEDKVMEAEAKLRLKTGQKLRDFWTPDLYPMLNRIVAKQFGLSPTVLSALNKHLAVKGPTNVLFILNEIVHNPDYIFTKQDIHDVYDKLEPYILAVL